MQEAVPARARCPPKSDGATDSVLLDSFYRAPSVCTPDLSAFYVSTVASHLGSYVIATVSDDPGEWTRWRIGEDEESAETERAFLQWMPERNEWWLFDEVPGGSLATPSSTRRTSTPSNPSSSARASGACSAPSEDRLRIRVTHGPSKWRPPHFLCRMVPVSANSFSDHEKRNGTGRGAGPLAVRTAAPSSSAGSPWNPD